MSKLRILVVVGTVRKRRQGRRVADWYLRNARTAAPQVDFDLLDIAELDLPLFSEENTPDEHHYSPLQERIAERIAAADAFVFVTGEYNHSIPGSLKNFMDYIVAEWAHKAAAFVGYGASGATRSIEHLIQVLHFLGVTAIPDHITINAIWDALDEDGNPKPGYRFGSIEKQLTELSWWAAALAVARRAAHPAAASAA